jgi:ribose/xylose/arabinose/galactoside ABC-type transport system permease subunit/ABC-type branched-subunit amino acid transport system ATPase component
LTRSFSVKRFRLPRLAAEHERPFDARNRLGLAFFCVLLIAYLGERYAGFLTAANLFVTLLSVTSIGLVGLGMTALLISGNVDLSVGGQYAFIGVCAAYVAVHTQSSVLGVLTGLALGAGLGQMNGRLVRLLRINPLIVTLGTASVLYGLAFVVAGGTSVFGFPGGMVHVAQTYYGPVPFPVIVGAVVYVLGSIVLLRTVVGLRTYAIGGSPNAARLSGINPDSYVTGLYTVTGLLVGLVSVMDVSRLGSAAPNVGVGFELDVLTAVILGGVAFNGGVGHPLGAFIGVFTIGVLDAGVVFAGVADYWQQVVQGAALLIALSADQVSVHRRGRRRTAVERVESTGPIEVQPDEEKSETDAHVRGSLDRGRGEVVLACHGLAKSYGAVAAVRDVSFSVSEGQILCLAGDNGAGKSTVIKMLSGALKPDAGTIEVQGQKVDLAGPGMARTLGIYTAYQELALCPNLGAAENLALGMEPTRTNWGIFSWRDDRAAVKEAEARLRALNIVLDSYLRPVRLLSGGQRQSVAIARVVQQGAKVVILDEPTAALGIRQTQSVLSLVQSLADAGVAVIMISHDLETIFEIAERIVVLRLGSVVFDGVAKNLTQSDFIHLLAGFPLGPREVSASRLTEHPVR